MLRFLVRPTLVSFSLVLALATGIASAATLSYWTQADIIYVDEFVGDDPLTDHLGVALPVGTPFQLGFFDGIPTTLDPATFGPKEWAAFTPLTGEDSLNPVFDTRIGDNDAPAGLITTSIIFDVALHQGIPGPTDPGVRVGLRFFNEVTIAESTHYNSVTAEDWILKPASRPTGFPVSLNMEPHAQDSLVWESGDTGFATTLLGTGANINVPEPFSLSLCLLGFGLALRRRR